MRNRGAGYTSRRREEEAASRIVSALSVRPQNLSTPAGNLSGGNQQKISIGRWLLADCDILIIDEPTVGVDVGAKEQIHQLIWNMAYRERKGIILISSDMAEIIRLSSRILIFQQQQIVGQLAAPTRHHSSYDNFR